jgi:protein TonB
MQADGFLNQKRRHPVAMTAAVAINLTAVTALLLAKSGYVPQVPTILIGDNIPLPTEPEPNPPKSQPETKARTKVYVPPVKQPARMEGNPGVEGTGVLPPSGGTETGTGEGTVMPPKPDPTPIPIPILTDPVPLASAARDFQPPYPPQLLRTGVEGTAVVRVLIGTDGRVKQVAIISADDPLFADATERQALRKWRFKPATRDGVAIENWKQLTVRFQITA